MSKRVSGRKRRLSARYLPHLADIAGLYVECGKNATATAGRVREEIGLPLSVNTLAQWAKRSPEFLAALEDAEIVAANATKAQPELRAPRDIAWFQAKQQELRTAHDEDDLSEKDRAALRRELRDLSAAIRAEEKHCADLADRKAERDFARFLRGFVEWLKAHYPRQADVLAPVLRAAMRSLPSIVKGGGA